MSDAKKVPDEIVEDEVPVADTQPAKGWGWLWLLPILAVGFSAYLWTRSMSERGEPIRISFNQGYGIKAGDALRYRGIDVGQVEKIVLNNDLGGIVCEVRLTPEASGVARKGSQFWVVRPNLSLSGPSGLETVVGAKYLAVIPGDGPEAFEFDGLESQPIVQVDDGGFEVLLTATQARGITEGSSLTYRQVIIGTLSRIELSENLEEVRVRAHIHPRYRDLVRTNTRFWKTGGARFTADLLKGINVDVDSVNSLVLGGISLANPPAGGTKADLRETFVLHETPNPEWLAWSEQANATAAVTASPQGSLEFELVTAKASGMNPGSPVSYRQIKVGELNEIALAPGFSNVVVRATVYAEYAELIDTETKFWKTGGAKVSAGLFSGIEFDMDSVQSLLMGGVSLARPATKGEAIAEGHRFELLEEPDERWEKWLEQ